MLDSYGSINSTFEGNRGLSTQRPYKDYCTGLRWNSLWKDHLWKATGSYMVSRPTPTLETRFRIIVNLKKGIP
jgi:hypothetical protein